ncbi:MAG: GNAT family N-acetyltransferase [Oscillospiraceae bacterium]|nr:GNAT family N-acetyltransferase [Oscillospiraceae bacterium]
MDHIKTINLEIRRFRETDIEPYIQIMTNPAVTKYLADGRGNTAEGVKEMLARFEAVWDEQGFGVFAVVETANGNIIGHCGFLPMKDSVELLYAFDASVWGKGYATEAGKAVLDYAKKQFDWAELHAITWPQNEASSAVLKKLGFSNAGQQEHFGVLMDELVLEL